ncbi:sulfite reductase flavoprotein subunit alpha [Leptospira sp. 2 VSF19]|uniref:assimilatory sulfite reductase (NADPH) n=1 Tax=Leptospira soteropolitanensis TaxID=2950025 RepID=A0AAW5VTQ3_9LEPT|nr:sulfite reductase flavoprotein subunit alpha [Leptospira soteropolitanensis]MCW7494505.1 sulfite reductase flavoprotein subunit alpha [Leptospira soteropolitanensis]MCW7502099.1 sulfite reductase flavoprotein subunit alpha [Leptospira soteropolitanensis]MCW7524351.1 sulfite reductase flavoprotein subunit alpha [Leptospira soteropolitanensis]MCW7528217.1 sulfite reductase flavoprotein subunit alpha [Leptospira soteropolitanensis]MCW7532069.1 sulfite reductase flavoprotein subunit alpha [Lept
MLSDEKRNRFLQLLKESTKDEWVWMSGYLAALTQPSLAGSSVDVSITPPVSIDSGTDPLHGNLKTQPIQCSVVYGTETGNSKKLGTELVKKLKELGVSAKLKSTDTYKAKDLKEEEYLFVIVSTHGDGEPPQAAKPFIQILKDTKDSLSKVKFAVLGLGDTSYPLFCQTGEDVDSLLAGLGAERIQTLGKCDVDFEIVAKPWMSELISKINAHSKTATTQTTKPGQNPVTKPASGGKVVYEGTVVTNIVLNDIGASKSTRHIEIKTPVPVDYLPGDSAGFLAYNRDEEILRILSLLQVDRETRLTYKGETWMAYDLFRKKVSIRFLPDRVIQKYATLFGKEIPSGKTDLDVLLTLYPSETKLEIQTLVDILEPIVPRYYSIASSPSAHGEDEVHLTVAEVEIETFTGIKTGFCSGFLSDLKEGDTIPFFIQRNHSFRLPNPDTDIIMIGPGTGIAPFRSFLFEREQNAGNGKNWLFFGERNFVSDFYYQTELLELMDTGVLHKLNTAFSRDTKQKVYVQDRMGENAMELLKWIENGAVIYLCGSKDPMSKDVDRKLIEILSERTFDTGKDASDYLKELEEAGRYIKDVY